MTWCFCVPIVATTACQGEVAAGERENAFSRDWKATIGNLHRPQKLYRLPVVACRKRSLKTKENKRKSATIDCLHRQRNSVMRGGALSYMTALAHSALLCRAPPSIHSVLVYLGSRSRTRHIGSSVWFRVITNDTQTMRKPTFMSELTALGTTRTEP